MTMFANAESHDPYLYDFIPVRADAKRIPTVLYSLQPIGVGTPFVESLSSYLARLAAAHMLPVSTLLRQVIANHLPKASHNLHQIIGHQRIIANMDGLGSDAAAFVDVLEKLTGQSNLHKLTMLPLSNLIADHKLLSGVSAWCPDCLGKQRTAGGPIYRPLLWSLQDFKKCPIHRNMLIKACPYCKADSPIIAFKTVIGYCHRCNAWLGSGTEGRARATYSADSNFFVRLYEWHKSVGYMRENPTFPSLLNYLTCNKSKKSYSSELKRQIYLKRAMIAGLCSGRMLPTFGVVLWLAKIFRVDPFDVLTMSGEEMECKDAEELASVDPSLLARPQVNWSQLHGLLRDVANGKASLMRVEDIAKVYKCPPEEIISKYPELCNEVTKRFNRLNMAKLHN